MKALKIFLKNLFNSDPWRLFFILLFIINIISTFDTELVLVSLLTLIFLVFMIKFIIIFRENFLKTKTKLIQNFVLILNLIENNLKNIKFNFKINNNFLVNIFKSLRIYFNSFLIWIELKNKNNYFIKNFSKIIIFTKNQNQKAFKNLNL